MSGQIFICYRRDDTAYVTGYINDRLCEEFGADAVFTDVDNIALGVDFRAILDETVGQCQVFLAVIGDHWLTTRNPDGGLRLQDPSDFVRIEIESALQRNIPVIPLLVGGTMMPSKDELPDSMKDLAFRNGTVIRPAPDFHADIDRLVISLKQYLRAVSPEPKLEDRKSDTSAAERRNADRAVNETARKKDDGSEPTRTIIRPEDEDRARHQAELRSSRTKNWWAGFVVRPFVVIGLVIFVAASWYIDFEYRQQFNDAITALKSMAGAARDDGTEIRAGVTAQDQEIAAAPTEPQGEADPAAEAETEVGPPAEAQDELVGESEPATERLANVQPEPDPVVEAREETDTVAEVESIAEEAGEIDPVTDTESDSVSEADAPVEDQPAVEPVVEAEPERVASEIFGDGVSLAARGDHAAAIEHYDEAIQLGVDSGFAYRQRGASYYALGNYEAAIKDFDEAIRLNAEDISAYLNRGDAYHASGDYEAAVMDYDEAIRLKADDADVNERRAASLEALERDEAAQSDLDAEANLGAEPDDPQ
jgi:tetratricopeptide (TPR) repeat protein